MPKETTFKPTRLFAFAFFALTLSACGMYGAGYPKPEYNRPVQSGDAEVIFESVFGTNTQFRAKADAKLEGDDCTQAKRVAYLQAMDSYYRDRNAAGPWKIAAPSDRPFLVSGQWTRYSTQFMDPLSKDMRVSPPTSCPSMGKVFVPRAGQQYKVFLRGAGPMVCSLSITSLDETPVESHDVPSCSAKHK